MVFSHRTTSSCGIVICYFRRKSFRVEDIKSDKNGHLLLLDAKIDDQSFVWLNIYNVSTEKE